MFDISGLMNIANQLGSTMQSVKGQLLQQPDEAAASLAAALEELAKTYAFVDEATVSYLSLIFLPDHSNLVQCRTVLLRYESGSLRIRGNEARAHCHKIANIYEKYLDRWFHRRLDSSQARQMQTLFDLLGGMDDLLVQGVENVTGWLTQEAHDTLNLVDAGQLDQANDRVKAARTTLLSVRRDITRALAEIRALQAEFIAASGTV